MSRVQYALPWVGYLYLAVLHPATWLLLGGALLAVAALWALAGRGPVGGPGRGKP